MAARHVPLPAPPSSHLASAQIGARPSPSRPKRARIAAQSRRSLASLELPRQRSRAMPPAVVRASGGSPEPALIVDHGHHLCQVAASPSPSPSPLFPTSHLSPSPLQSCHGRAPPHWIPHPQAPPTTSVTGSRTPVLGSVHPRCPPVPYTSRRCLHSRQPPCHASAFASSRGGRAPARASTFPAAQPQAQSSLACLPHRPGQARLAPAKWPRW